MKHKTSSIDESNYDAWGLFASVKWDLLVLLAAQSQLLAKHSCSQSTVLDGYGDYCEGTVDCLPTCPQQTIAFLERKDANYKGIGATKKHNWSINLT
jgi:hypothetical protein